MNATGPSEDRKLLDKLLSELRPFERVFIMLIAEGGRVGESYTKARPEITGPSANVQGWRVLQNEKCKTALRVAQRVVGEDIMVSARDVLREWLTIATADPAEIVRTVHRCCRHCHGAGHAFQWVNEEEYAKACDEALQAVEGTDAMPQLPDCSGGFGFNSRRLVVADCPACLGEGRAETYIEATDNLSPAARRLYAGVEETKSGVKVKLRDQDAAWRHIAQYLGMLTQEVKHRGAVGVVSAGDVELTDEQRAVLRQAVTGLL